MHDKSKLFVWVKVTIVFCFILIIAGCGNENDSEKVTLDWMILESTKKVPDFFEEEVIRPFEEENPDVEINLIPNKDAVNLMRQQLASGGGPDIIGADGPITIRQFADAGYLLPLDDKKDKYEWGKRFADWAYQTGIYDDKLYGLPGEQEALMVWYNKNLFEKNDWKVPSSLDDLLSLSEQMKQKGIIPFAFGASDYRAANEWWLSVVYNAYLGKKEFREVLEGNLPWTDEKVKEATNIWVDMWREGYISDKQSQAITGDEAWNLFDSKKAGMIMTGTWALSRLESQERSFDYDFFVMPAWRDDTETNLPLAIGTSTGINANTKHPEIAAKFLNWIHSEEVAKKYAQLGRVIPVKSLDINDIDGIDSKTLEVYDEIQNYVESEQEGYASWTFWSPKVQYYLWDNIESVFVEQLTVDEYLENAQEEMEQDKNDNMLTDFED